MTAAADSAPTSRPKQQPSAPSKSGHSSGSGSGSSPSNGARSAQGDPLSDRATSLLIRRTLCPQEQRGDKSRDGQAQRPVEELLPPLTSRNDVDLQLYAFLAIILREFVQSWYGRITTDEEFVAEIVHTIAHCTRALEQRGRKVDFESLLLDEIPDLLDRHIKAYRTAHEEPLSRPPVKVDPRQVYHSLCPLPPLSPVPLEGDDDHNDIVREEQQKNEAAYRQLLVQAVLAVLLPTEDLENPCLTSLVEQIFSELIIGNIVVQKAAQPWLIWEGICILSSILQGKRNEAGRHIGGRQPPDDATKAQRTWSAHGFFLSIVNVFVLFITSVRLLFGAVATSSSLPPRSWALEEKGSPPQGLGSDYNDNEGQKHGALTETAIIPALDFRIWSCVGRLLELPSRMPWLSGCLALLQHGLINGPGRIGRLNGTLDRVLAHHARSLFAPSHIPPLLRALRGALFPNNAPGKPTLVAPSSDAELRALRRRAASALCALLPRGLGRWYFGGRFLLLHRRRRSEGVGAGGDGTTSANSLGVHGTSERPDCDDRDDDDDDNDDDDMALDGMEGILMVFSDEYCNRHLMYTVLELILVRLIPELGEKGVQELWDERLGSLNH